VQAPGGIADQFAQTGFDLHMDVFKLDMLGNALCRIFLLDRFQAGDDCGRILGGDDALCAKH
jgi:hypothetical protein